MSYWSDVGAACKKIDMLPAEARFLAHAMMAVQGRVRELRRDEPFEDWDLDQIISAVKEALK